MELPHVPIQLVDKDRDRPNIIELPPFLSTPGLEEFSKRLSFNYNIHRREDRHWHWSGKSPMGMSPGPIDKSLGFFLLHMPPSR